MQESNVKKTLPTWTSSNTTKNLRDRAEEKIRSLNNLHNKDLGLEETRQLLHQIQVHQIELEMQNEELSKAYSDLEASHALYFDLYSIAPLGYCTLSKNGIIVKANLTLSALLGVDRKQLTGEPLSRFIVPDEIFVYHPFLNKLFEIDSPKTCELQMKKNDGEVFWAYVSAYVREGFGNEPECYLVISDITDRKQTEQSLKTARNEAINEMKQLEAVMAALPVGIAIVDERGGTVRSNKIYEELWGSPRPTTKDVGDYEAYKAWWIDTGKPVQPDEWASARAILKGESVIDQMMEIESFDGVRKIVMNSAAPVRDANGRIIGSAVAIHDVTNIKNIEQELMDRVSELEAVFSAQNDAVLMYDTGLNVKQVNQAFLSKYGFDPAGLNVQEIVQRLSCRPLNGRRLLLEEQPTPRALRGEKVADSLFEITLPDGSDRIIDTSSGPMLQGDRITGTVTVWHDITEFKLAEEKLRESQERLILAADAGQVGMFDLNMESGELQWTQQHEKIFGYVPISSITNRTYKDWSERVHPEDLPRVEAHMCHAREEKVPFDIEYRIIWPDKSIRWVNVSSRYYFDDDGHCKWLRGAVRDITERKQSEEKINELSQRLTYHVDNSPLAVIEWGADMRITRWSNMAERIFGWKAEEVIGKRMEDFHWIYLEDTQQVEDVSTDLQTGSNLRRFSSNRNYRKDGTVVHCEWYNSSLMDESGKLRSIMSLVLDVTKRKQAEKKILESLKEKEVLLKEIHHRVKNNLQIISSLISLQTDSLANEQLTSAMGDVRDRVRTIALVHEKLYQTEDIARLDFAEYAADLLTYLWEANHGSIGKVHLSTAVASLILPIEMAVPCGLILNELASNALKHAFPSGLGGEVAVTLEHDHAKGSVCLRVRDNGIGLPVDLDWHQSSSLGLRLVQILAGQIGGTVQTGPGPGTEFQISFNVNGISS